MAINIKFDLAGNPEPPTIILANRNGNKLGALNVDAKSIDLKDILNNASEFAFTLNKSMCTPLIFKINNTGGNNEIDENEDCLISSDDYIFESFDDFYFTTSDITELLRENEAESGSNVLTITGERLWDEVVDFKLVYCKEWDTWFEIKVEIDEATETVKTVFCKQLGQAELSQIMLYDIEINTEKDINRSDYKVTTLYNENDPDASLLHRLLKDKAPHYSIIHVDSTIADIQRAFSFSDKSIYDAFQEVGEEIGCLFVFNSNSNEYGKIHRTISVYDLEQNCLNINCNYRGEFTDVCPKCGSTKIKNGYGEDTSIFVTSDELASGGIQLVTDTDSVKNCFKLEAGDDLMTATIRNCNPNGTDYIWYFSDSTKKDMSDELVAKIESYDKKYEYYRNEYKCDIKESAVNNYNSLVTKYSKYNKELNAIKMPIIGYSALMDAYYDVIDLCLYLESGFMPSVEISETTAAQEIALLTANSLSPVAVADITVASLSTVDNAVLTMAKTIVRPTYKIEIENSEMYDDGNNRIWNGNFIVTNYSNEEDTAVGRAISIEINDELKLFIEQKLEKSLNKENTDDLSVSGLFKKDYDDFCAELKKYALNPLISFHDACQACLDILIEQGVAEKKSDNDLYGSLYEPYYEKLIAIESEIKVREDEIGYIKGVYKQDNTLKIKGLLNYIEDVKNTIQNYLNFEKYIGKELWLEFCSFRREDKYSNDNYISDGLNNLELFKRANEFIEVASKEIYKSSEMQHSISTTLKNLLAIPKFKPLAESFKLGNWIRVQIDDKIYKLRLIKYDISFSNFDNIPVEFSDVTKIRDGYSDIESILSQATSMATSYDTTQKQAEDGNSAQVTIKQWLANGLNSALVQIQNNENEEITITKNGLLARSYSEITDTYSPEQLKLTHNIMAYTDDNWRTVRQAIGKHDYVTYNSSSDSWVSDVGYGMSADFVTAGQVAGSKVVGGEIYSSNYHKGSSSSETDLPQGTYINLETGDFEFGGGKLVYDATEQNLVLNGVTILWSTTNPPSISDISGLEHYDEKIDELDAAVAKHLGIGGGTVINEDSVISPYIGGGYLNITNIDNNSRVVIDPNNLTGNNYIFQVHNGDKVTVGVNADGDAEFSGTIIGGSIKSKNCTQNDDGIYSGTYIDLDNDIIWLGKEDEASTINLCGGLGQIKFDTTDYESNKKGLLISAPIHDFGNIEIRTNDSNGEIKLYAGDDLADVYGWAGSVLARTNGEVFLEARSWSSEGLSLSSVQVYHECVRLGVKDSFLYLNQGCLEPSPDNTISLGTSSSRWKEIYLGSSIIQTSDEREKENIIPLGTNPIMLLSLDEEIEQTDIHSELFDRLRPVQYNFINDKSRIHYGLVAQDVAAAMDELGIDENELDLVHHDYWIDEETGEQKESYGLAYNNLIAMLIHEVQKLKQNDSV